MNSDIIICGLIYLIAIAVSIKYYKNKGFSKREMLKKTFKINLLGVGIIFIVCLIFLFSLYVIEAYTQKEIVKEKSKGDCRIVNTKLAYDNNYSLQAYRLDIKKSKNTSSAYHIIAVDKNLIIHDNYTIVGNVQSLNKTKLNNLSKRYHNIKLLGDVKFKNHSINNVEIYDYLDYNSYFFIINTYAHYFTYKYLKE